MSDAKHTQTPWGWETFDRPTRQHEGVDGVVLCGADAALAFACVNALAGCEPEKLAGLLEACEPIPDMLKSVAPHAAKPIVAARWNERALKLAAALAAFRPKGGGE